VSVTLRGIRAGIYRGYRLLQENSAPVSAKVSFRNDYAALRCAAFAQQFGELLHTERSEEVVSLSVATPKLTEQLVLPGVFDAFGYDL